jgi:putative endonuclease
LEEAVIEDRHDHRYFVYIMSSDCKSLDIGMTSNLRERVQRHKDGRGSRYAAAFNTTKLVYFEEATDLRSAARRERQMKVWLRARKLQLIESVNPHWLDLSEDYCD